MSPAGVLLPLLIRPAAYNKDTRNNLLTQQYSNFDAAVNARLLLKI